VSNHLIQENLGGGSSWTKSMVYLKMEDPMNALTFVFTALCVFAMAYRFYGLFIAKKVLSINPDRKTPAVAMEDGHDYHETDKYVLFRSSFRGYRGHPLAGTRAGGTIRISSRRALDHRRRGGRRGHTRHGHSFCLRSP
jgi:hypothetical protein